MFAIACFCLALSVAVGEPSCSFRDDHCVYNVKLGKQGQCADLKTKLVAADDTTCCGSLQTDVNNLQNEVNALTRKLSGLDGQLPSTTPMTSSQGPVHTTTATPTSEQQLMQLLAQKEAELKSSQEVLSQKKLVLQSVTATLLQKERDVNTSKAILSHVTTHSQDEVRRLRQQLVNATRDLSNCRGVLTLKTGSFQPTQTLTTPYKLTYCPFEDSRQCGYVQDKSDQGDWFWMTRSPSETTGPREDHTYGSPKGHYMAINPSREASTVSTASTVVSKVARVTSLPFEPAPTYCIRFWHNMYGKDTKTLKVYAKVGNGLGYPVWSKTGNHGQNWQLGEITLGSEYTHTAFSVVFEANHKAYSTRSYSSSHHTIPFPHNVDGDIAVDDVYAYNVSCKDLPTCPPGSYIRKQNGSSSCYTFHTTPLDWYKGQVTCHKEGATSHLVSVNTQEEHEYLVSTITSNPSLNAAGSYGWFTSGNDERSEHHFDWTDTGTPYTNQYSDWHAGQPNNVGNVQNCLLLQYADDNYAWGDVACTERHPYICEVELPTVN